ncbi:hypothetical protein PHLCEN_2v12177 [Hermanssonia centrifuga]|uniref:Uncharacterized protein n=1 Tax=Hermanssonia centrifuga TaxID=98765 RepID=A0A2R6NHU8_9APHY|nr:hypothetical protein PHLCEN_2v12177 [Hermanssonia centrifuga]
MLRLPYGFMKEPEPEAPGFLCKIESTHRVQPEEGMLTLLGIEMGVGSNFHGVLFGMNDLSSTWKQWS